MGKKYFWIVIGAAFFVVSHLFSDGSKDVAVSGLNETNMRSYALAANPARTPLSKRFEIDHGPFVQNVSEDSATISWTTNFPSIAYVEVAPDDGTGFKVSERPNFYETSLGRKRISKVHNVVISGLTKGTKYRCRAVSQEVIGADWNYLYYSKSVYAKTIKKGIFKFTTSDNSATKVRFAVFNDVHEDIERLSKQLAAAKGCDFICFNGDICNASISVENFYRKFLDEVSVSAGRGASVVFLRGNHETRGIYAQNIHKLFPTPENSMWRAFRFGPAAFLCIDVGECKSDSLPQFCDNNNFDEFRSAEAQWLKKAVLSKDFQSAPIKIVFSHTPLVSGLVAKWEGARDAVAKFNPILDGRGVDILFCGHLHNKKSIIAKDDATDFFNFVNSDKNMLIVEADTKKILVKIYDAEGKFVREKNFNAKSAK